MISQYHSSDLPIHCLQYELKREFTTKVSACITVGFSLILSNLNESDSSDEEKLAEPPVNFCRGL